MFIDEWFDKDFYKQLPLGYHTQANFAFAQFFWTHAYYPHGGWSASCGNESVPTRGCPTSI
jgi:hypothetical protein